MFEVLLYLAHTVLRTLRAICPSKQISCTSSLNIIQLITSSPTSYHHLDSALALEPDPGRAYLAKSSLIHPYCHPYAPVHALDLDLDPDPDPDLDLDLDLAATRKAADHTQSIHYNRKCLQASNSSEVTHSREETVYPANRT